MLLLAQGRVRCYLFRVGYSRRALLASALLGLVCFPATGRAQVFLASQPHPNFAIGPLFVTVAVRPDLGPVTVTLSWSLTPPPGRLASETKQDLEGPLFGHIA